jgi:superfamily II DNA or RNA helicase
MINIEKIDNVHLRIYSDPGITQELSQFFTFEVPGYKFTPAYRSGKWDGKIRMYDMQRKTLYVGLLKYVINFAEKNQYPIKYLNDVTSNSVITKEEVMEYADWLKPSSRGVPITIRDYQIDAVHKALLDERVLLLSPTASGKSFIIYTLMRHHLDENRKCIIVVPTTSLVEQLYADFADYSTNNGWKVDRHCQKLYSGFTRDFSHDVMITTWQSIYKQPLAWFNQFNVIFGDEAHQFKAKSLTTIMDKLVNVQYRIGTTGTLDNSKVNKLVLEGVFGPVHRVTTTKELMDSNQVAKLKITCIVLKYDEVSRKIMNKAQYPDEINFIIAHEKRNRFIRNLAIDSQGNTLVLFQMVAKHGRILYEMIKDKVHDKRKVFFVYGGTDTEAREEARKLTENESDAIIIASFGVFSTGINIPSIENVIFASPSKSKIRNLQSIGRGLRLKDGKTHCNLYDISDDLHWKSYKNHTLGHLAERLKTYSEEQFTYKIVEVQIE